MTKSKKKSNGCVPCVWFKVLLWNVCVTDDHGYVPCVIVTIPSFFPCHQFLNMNTMYTMDATSEAGTTWAFGAPGF